MENYHCKCKVRESCLLDNNCVTLNTVYEAQITSITNDQRKRYLCVSETPFKERLRNHLRDLRHKKYMKSTEYQISTLNIPTIKQRIVRKVCNKTRPLSNYSKLCLIEKCFIIQSLDDTNNQSDVINNVWNQNKLF